MPTEQEKIDANARKEAEAQAAANEEQRVKDEALAKAQADVAAVAQAEQDPPVDPTSVNAGAIHPKRRKGSVPSEQTAATHDVVRQYEDDPAVPLGTGVSEDRRPRVPYGVSL